MDKDMKTPPAHIIDQYGERVGICLSRLAKWVAGVGASLIAALLIGAVGFAWQSNATLTDVVSTLQQIDDRLNRIDRRQERMEDRIERKADKP